MRLTRRTFIQASATTAGLLAAGCATTEPLSAAMALKDHHEHGMALGAWGAVFATAEGLALAVSGIIYAALVSMVPVRPFHSMAAPSAVAVLAPAISMRDWLLPAR